MRRKSAVSFTNPPAKLPASPHRDALEASLLRVPIAHLAHARRRASARDLPQGILYTLRRSAMDERAQGAMHVVSSIALVLQGHRRVSHTHKNSCVLTLEAVPNINFYTPQGT
jgi:hypothetical protein